MPLVGIEESSLDDKGRVLISKAKRDALGSKFHARVTEIGCIACYPNKAFLQLGEESMQGHVLDPDRQDFTRMVLGPAATNLAFDPQGRVVIPKFMRVEAGISQDVEIVVVGCGDRVEIWSQVEWIHYRKDPAGYKREARDDFRQIFREAVLKKHGGAGEASPQERPV